MVFPHPKAPLILGAADLHSSSGMCLLGLPCCPLDTCHVRISFWVPGQSGFTLPCVLHLFAMFWRSVLSACAFPFQEHPGQCGSHSSFSWTIPHCLCFVAFEGMLGFQTGFLTSGGYLPNQLILVLVFYWFLCLCRLKNCNLSFFWCFPSHFREKPLGTQSLKVPGWGGRGTLLCA